MPRLRLVSLLTLALVACTTETNGAGGTDDTISRLIGPEGGTVELAGGGKVVIPEGALTEEVSIKVTKLELDDLAPVPSNLEAAGKPYAFEPHGTVFAQPVKIEVPFDGSATELRPLKLDDEADTSWQTLVGSEKDVPNRKLSINTTSFSILLAARPRRDSGVITLPDGAIVEDSGFDAGPTVDAGDAGETVDAGDAGDAGDATDAGETVDASDAGGTADAGDGGGPGVMVDECFNGQDNCDANATCEDLPVGFQCTCDAGYMGDGTSCIDIADCATNNGGCDLLATCTEGLGEPSTCTCPSGYTTPDNGMTCADIDECETNNGGCGGLSAWACTNNVAAAPTCTDIDECALNTDTCSVNAGCANASGGFVCTCNSGFIGDGQTCNDVNECLSNNGGCDALTICTNNVGAAASCGACPAGYLGTGATGCTPTLTGLALSSGSLSPALSSMVTAYTAAIGITSQTLTLTPTVPSGATLTINGQAAVSNSAWQSPVLNLGANAIPIVVSQAGHPNRSYTLTVTRGYQEAYVKASNTGANDSLGSAVALSADGNTLAVGAPYEDSNAPGVGGNQTDNSATDSGAVYVFTRAGNVWSQQAYVKASNPEANDNFGDSVALSADGNTLAVGALYEDSSATGVSGNQSDNGATDSGAVYVFTRAGSVWSQQAYVKASNTGSNDWFGSSVALSTDGTTLAVGAEREASNATGIGGNQSDNGVFQAGAVYVFTRAGSVWTQQAYVKASNTGSGDLFGFALALSADGNTLTVGAPYEASNATGINGNQGDNSMLWAGAVYVFTRAGSVWSQQAYVKASNPGGGDDFGLALALSADGNTLAVGSPIEQSNATGINGNQADNSANESGAVYVFTRTGSTWTQQAYVKASNTGASDYFGIAVALSGDSNTLAVGARQEDGGSTGISVNQVDDGASNSGATYVLTRAGSVWTQQAYVKASNTGANDRFSWSVALSADGTALAVGAQSESSNATGANGNQTDNSATASGAVYVIR